MKPFFDLGRVEDMAEGARWEKGSLISCSREIERYIPYFEGINFRRIRKFFTDLIFAE